MTDESKQAHDAETHDPTPDEETVEMENPTVDGAADTTLPETVNEPELASADDAPLAEDAASAEPEVTQSDDEAIAEHLSELRQDANGAGDASGVTSAEGIEPQETEPEQKGGHILRNVILALLAVVLLAAISVGGYAYYVESQAVGHVPAGVTLAQTTALGGLDESEVRSQTEALASDLLSSTVIVTGSEDTTDTFEANTISKQLSELVKIDTESMVNEAVDIRAQTPLITRLKVDLLNDTIDHDIKLAYTIDTDALNAFVAEVATANDQAAVNAKITESNGAIVIKPGANGYKTNKKELISSLKEAISEKLDSNDSDSRELAVGIIGISSKPKTTTESLSASPALVVTLSRRQIALYNGEKLIKTYQCAIGTADHPTPVGTWKIVLKRYNPTWVNPGSDWAKNMPKTIGPGPTNPLGVRALNLNASGIRIHGTTSLASIGTAASHGCLRMRNSDIIDLYPRVNVGTPVFIIQ